MYSMYVLILCRYFPKVFGPNEDAPLQESATNARFKALTNEVCVYVHMSSIYNDTYKYLLLYNLH